MIAKAKPEWIQAAKEAQGHAYVPYSHFSVGACLVTEDDQMITGVNIENASYGLTNCAERTAVFKAVSEGIHSFKHLVVIADSEEPIPPCGACRQVLREFCPRDMPVTLVSKTGETRQMTIEQLLPYSFSKDNL